MFPFYLVVIVWIDNNTWLLLPSLEGLAGWTVSIILAGWTVSKILVGWSVSKVLAGWAVSKGLTVLVGLPEGVAIVAVLAAVLLLAGGRVAVVGVGGRVLQSY